MRSAASARSGSKRIGVVEDHSVVINGLRTLVARDPDIDIAGAAASVVELLADTADLDLVLLDLRLPDETTPTENVAALHAVGIAVLVFTSGDEPYLVREAARAGVLGVVRKSERDELVLDAIRAAAFGEAVPTLDWAAAIDSDEELDGVALSPRQREVLALYASGESAARVGELTGLSPDTVEVYLGRIRVKYAEAGRPTRSKTDMLKRAIEDGVVPVPRVRFRRWGGGRHRNR